MRQQRKTDSNDPRCSIIIPVYNRADVTRRCLDVLLGQPSTRERAEIIVVDDASDEPTATLLASYGERVRLVTHEANTGFAGACNDGAAGARGELFVFLNSDTIPRDGWLAALVDHADTHPEASVVGSKLLFPDDTVQHAGVVICQDRYPRHVYSGFPADHPAVNVARRFQVVTAACMLVRGDVFRDANGFDTGFVNGYEDVDLCLRLGEQGLHVHYCPDSVLYHLEAASRGSFRDPASLELYRSRWLEHVEPDDVAYYLKDGLMSLAYRDGYPLELRASPRLASGVKPRRGGELECLLAKRSWQVSHLLREVVRLLPRVAQTGASAPKPVAEEGGGAASPALHGESPDDDELRALFLDAHAQLAARDRDLEAVIDRLQQALVRLSELGALDSAPFEAGSYFGYHAMIERVRTAVRANLPVAARIVVVSRGDEELLELGGREAWHFPRADDGAYAGHHPADGDAAIAHLEELRNMGSEFLLIPATGLWWLQHYVELKEHLERRYETVFNKDDTCMIVDLQ